MKHLCGIIIDDLERKDAGTWRCHLDLEDEDTGRREKEVQEFTFDVTENPGPGQGSLCSQPGGGEDDQSRLNNFYLLINLI